MVVKAMAAVEACQAVPRRAMLPQVALAEAAQVAPMPAAVSADLPRAAVPQQVPAVAQAMFRPTVLQAQAVPKQAAKAVVARPTLHPTVAVLHAPVLNMSVRRTTLLVPLRRVPTEATHQVEAITEATAPAVPTIEAAHLREVPLQVPAVAQAAATAAEAAAQVQAAAIAQAEVAAAREAEAIAQAAEAVRAAVEEDKFQPKLQI